MLRFALAGNPNSGKTTLFNSLTGSTAHVGNWPGVTVDKKEGIYKKAAEPISIVDLPGIYSLSPYTPEEVIARNFILEEKPDCIINIVDATNLERNLYLTTQLMEIDCPVVIALNMIDEVEKSGDKIDEKELNKRLELPVVKISALKETGLSALMESAYAESKKGRKGISVLKDSALNHLIKDVKIALEGQAIENPLFHAIKLVELDELETKMHPSALVMVNNFKATFTDDVFGNDFEAIIADARYKVISDNFSAVLVRHNSGIKMTSSDKADIVLTHKIWSIPIFLLILFALFHTTFSTNFLFLKWALPEGWTSFAGTPFEGVLGTEGINSPGVILQNLMTLLTDTLTKIVGGWLNGAPEWVSGFLTEGVLGGVLAIFSFLPQILLLFLFFSILEDSGYMARIAFILDRIFRKFGLSGRAFMPMIMGFGCSVPAMVNTRTLSTQNERTTTIRVIPFFCCGAKLPILTAIAGGIVVKFGLANADIITYSMYVLGILVAVLSVLFMRNTFMRGETPPFIMELPSYRMPQFKNLMLHMWDKLKHFVKKAFTVILASTIVVWFVSHFSFSWQFLTDESINDSILANIGKLIQPLFTPLGFGSQLTNWGWVFVVAAAMGLIAKENVIAAFGTLAACIVTGFVADETMGGIDAVVQLISATGVTPHALIAFIAFNMLTIPCFAAVATAKAELPDKKSFVVTLLFWVLTSYFVSMMIYLIGSWWWTSFIFGALFIATVLVIVLINRRRNVKNV